MFNEKSIIGSNIKLTMLNTDVNWIVIFNRFKKNFINTMNPSKIIKIPWQLESKQNKIWQPTQIVQFLKSNNKANSPLLFTKKPVSKILRLAQDNDLWNTTKFPKGKIWNKDKLGSLWSKKLHQDNPQFLKVMQ